MKKVFKVFIWIISIFLVIFICGSVFIALYGKQIVVDQIEKNLKMKTTLEKISLSMPFSVHLTGLKIGDLFKADKISISPNIFSLFPGKIVLGSVTLVNPEVTLVQDPDGKLNLPKLEGGGGAPPVLVTGLIIENGKINFTDKKVSPEGLTTILSGINARISKVMMPLTSLDAEFNMDAQVQSAENKRIGDLSLKGWIDFRRKDMDAEFKVKDLDAVYFGPYYGDFISQKKLLSADLNLASTFKAKDNDLNIDTDFKLSGLVYAPVEPGAEQELSIFNLEKQALDLFTDKEGNLNLEFNIETKFDKPDIGGKKLRKVILTAAAKNLINQNPGDVYEKVMDIGKQFEQLFKKKKD
ncbi:MAG: DUF748 domain-containing protein [Candidatus Omnitrophica bacterium]|nr:DUF748 domain-containing protein [Candidatus Omnitrophota bacterium]